MNRMRGIFLLLILVLFRVTPVLAQSDDLIQREIETLISESEKLWGNQIEIHVDQRLVVLTG